MTRAEAEAAKLRQVDDDRRTVEEWVEATDNARCFEVWSGTNGHHCRLFSSVAGNKRAHLVFRSEIHDTQGASYAAAAEWVRGQQ